MCDQNKTSDPQDVTIRMSNVTIRITTNPETDQSCSCNNTDKTNDTNELKNATVTLNISSELGVEDIKVEGVKVEGTPAPVLAPTVNSTETPALVVTPIANPVVDTIESAITPIVNSAEEVVSKPKKSKKSFFRTLYIAILLGAITLPAMIAVYFGLSFQTVISDSMTPTVHAGDMFLSKVVPISSINPGDIALILEPGSTLYRSHRVVTIIDSGDTTTVTTRGDANPNLDDPVVVDSNSQTRRVVAVIPKLGFISNAFSNAIAEPKVKLGLVVGFLLLGLANLTRVTVIYLRKRKNPSVPIRKE